MQTGVWGKMQAGEARSRLQNSPTKLMKLKLPPKLTQPNNKSPTKIPQAKSHNQTCTITPHTKLIIQPKLSQKIRATNSPAISSNQTCVIKITIKHAQSKTRTKLQNRVVKLVSPKPPHQTRATRTSTPNSMNKNPHQTHNQNSTKIVQVVNGKSNKKISNF